MAPLAFNSNLHPAETVAELEVLCRTFAGPVRERLGWERVGIDLRLGLTAIAELQADPGAVDRLRSALDRAGCALTTVNAFPLQPFQAEVVKESPYDPDWSRPERLQASLALIPLLDRLSDEHTVTISTVPGSFKPWGEVAAQRRDLARGLGLWAAAAARHAEATGRRRILCPEPEPWCTLEFSTEVAGLWRGELASIGLAACQEALDGDAARAERALAEHLGVCYDTCHVSVAFEDQHAAVDRLLAAGCRPLKVQVSACPEVRDPHRSPGAVAALAAMAEPRFLHQTAARDDLGIRQIRDLDGLQQLLDDMPEADAVRSHFHIPIDRAPTAAGLHSTSIDSLRGLAACQAAGALHVAVETYTWSILAGDDGDRIAGTVRELRWLAERLAAPAG